VFIEGEAGIGKSSLLSQFQELASRIENAKQMRFVYGYCYEDNGGQNAYQPFVEVLSTLLETNKTSSNLAIMFLSILRETGIDWLNMIPGVGSAVGASIKTASIAGQWALGTGNNQLQADSLTNQYIKSISKIVTKYRPMIVVIEDAHWIDESSCNLLMRLSSRVTSLPVLVVVTCRPSYLNEGHPLDKIRNELLMKNLISVLPVSGLDAEETKKYIVRRFGSVLNLHLAEWLTNICKGLPLFATQYLNLLEQNGVIQKTDTGQYAFNGEIKSIMGKWEVTGHLANTAIPETIEALLEEQIKRILEEDREMLQVGAVQGEQFLSSILADLLHQEERSVLKRLRRVMEQHHIVNIYSGSEVSVSKSEVYSFEHIMLQQMLYKKLSPRERVLYHQDVAGLLEKMLADEKNSTRRLILEVANHFDQGDLPLKAAHYYKLVSQSLVIDGAYTEAIQICKRAIEIIKKYGESNHLKAELIELLLVSTRWRRSLETKAELSLLNLAKEGEELAEKAGDFSLLARLKHNRAILVGETEGLSSWIQGLRDALEATKKADDSIGEFMITSQLGQELRGQDFKAGIQLQRHAMSLFKEKVLRTNQEVPSEITKQYYLMQTLLGVGEFDSSHFEEAIDLLQESANGFKRLGVIDELPECLNYLAQTYFRLGLFEKAEEALIEAIEVVQDADEAHSWNGYNLALRGKLYLEWDRIDDAAAPILLGWQESQKTQIKWQTSLVRNYYAELLMNPKYQGFNLSEADLQLAITIEETQRSGYHRSAIMALSLRSLVSLIDKKFEDAFTYSSQAVSYLRRMGTLPALRAEEILFNHYQVLGALGNHNEARHYIRQASTILERKADSIKNKDYRFAFLERVRLNRDIRKSVRSL
jgi:tetratricopeptide (TPR) repeat protein